ncbi:MAG: glycosyltransferase [Pikeienuella sp.]
MADRRAPVDEGQFRLVGESGLFDADWYCRVYPDVGLTGMRPAMHYLRVGARLGRNPSPRFDTEGYAEANRELLMNGVNPLVHFLRFGRKLGLSPRPRGDVETPPPARFPPFAASKTEGKTPHYGKVLDRLVKTHAERIGRTRGGPEYSVVKTEFDVAFYLMRYRDLARRPDVDLVRHYLRHGAKEGKDPHPSFSTKGYLRRYPEVAKSGQNPFYHWIVTGRAKGYIAEPFKEFDAMCALVGKTPAEAQTLLQNRRRDLRARLEHGALGEMVARAAALEPLIAHSWSEAVAVKTPPFHSDNVISRVVTFHRLQEAAEWRRARFVIVLNRPRWGGGRRMEGHIVHALAEDVSPEDVVIINTDEGGELPAGRFPDGCRHLDFAELTAGRDENVRQRLLAELLRSLRPEAVLNINSRLFWAMLQSYGKALSASTALFVGMFCNEQTPYGFWNGYPARFFYRYFDLLTGVFTDSHDLAESLSAQFMVPEAQRAKLRVLEAPVDPDIPVAAPPRAGGRPQIFWSGRFDAQKRLDVVYTLAAAMPEADFRMWGEPVLRGVLASLEKPDNVIHEGVYASFADLPMHECDAWLYTAEWDGVPSLLIEVSMTGAPIVGSLIGGTGEILQDGLSWPIREIENVEHYAAALREVLADPVAARNRARALRERLVETRTPANYRRTLLDAFGFDQRA